MVSRGHLRIHLSSTMAIKKYCVSLSNLRDDSVSSSIRFEKMMLVRVKETTMIITQSTVPWSVMMSELVTIQLITELRIRKRSRKKQEQVTVTAKMNNRNEIQVLMICNVSLFCIQFTKKAFQVY